MIKMLCFDMDGTVADLYNYKNWLEKIRSDNPEPYEKAAPMWDMKKLTELLYKIQKKGIEVRIVTWLSMNSSEGFKQKTRQAKKKWLAAQGFPYDKFHGIQYGRTKADAVRKALAAEDEAILIDDNEKIRQGWSLGRTVDPQAIDLISWLEELLK